jgi:hypothetical protein
MKHLLQTAAVELKRSRRVGTLGIMSWVLGANAAGAFGQHLNQIITGAISDSIGGQVLQSASLLAGMNSGGLGYDSIAIQVVGALVGSTLLSICPYLFSKLRSHRPLVSKAQPARDCDWLSPVGAFLRRRT